MGRYFFNNKEEKILFNYLKITLAGFAPTLTRSGMKSLWVHGLLGPSLSWGI